jgi:hypothetical protein
LNLSKQNVEDVITGDKRALVALMEQMKRWEGKRGIERAYQILNKPGNMGPVLLPAQ